MSASLGRACDGGGQRLRDIGHRRGGISAFGARVLMALSCGENVLTRRASKRENHGQRR